VEFIIDKELSAINSGREVPSRIDIGMHI